MSNLFWKLLVASPVLFGTAFATTANAQTPNDSAIAQTDTLKQVSAYEAESRNDNLNQVTSVSQFSDVKPTDWAYQALQSLVERYGCIVGYPDKTFRGNRALTRYEFAAGLNACLDKIQELIAASTSDFVKKEDLEVIKKLQEEFAGELAALRGRVDALDVRTATLEKQQFSTTTKLSGEAIFAAGDTFGDAATVRGNKAPIPGVNKGDNTQTVFQDRVRLALDSSFTGRDRLRIRLQANNAVPFASTFTGTNETRLSFDGSNSNSVQLDKLYYRFPVGQNLRVQIDAINNEYYNGLISTLSPFESDGQGAVSRFGRFSPIYRSNSPNVSGSTGVTFDYAFGPKFSLQGGITGDRDSNNPSVKNGLFNGDFTAIGQLVFRPSNKLDIAFTYSHSYFTGSSTLLSQSAPNLTGSTGTGYAANPFNGNPVTSDNLGAELQWRLSKGITLGGWYGYSFAHNSLNSDQARMAQWAAFLAFPDLGKKGNLGGILFGMTPRVLVNDYRVTPTSLRSLDQAPPYELEAFYRYRVSDNISVTPGAFVLFNPEGNSANSTQVVGVIRTTFSF